MASLFSLSPEIDNYCVLGNPIAHSKSPQIHKLFAQQTGQQLNYQAVLVELGHFAESMLEFQRSGGKGLNITVPFKEDAWGLVDTRTVRAEKAGAVNTIWFTEDGVCHGDTTDGTGLVRDLLRYNIELKNKRLLVLGAGGAVRGVLDALLGEEPDQVLLVNRTLTRAQKLAQIFSDSGPIQACGYEVLANHQFDIVVNGTSASLKGDLPALPGNIFTQDACCYDMVYGDKETVFVTWARENGASLALDGLGMLVEQAAESFFIWRGVRPDTEPVIDMLRKPGLEGVI